MRETRLLNSPWCVYFVGPTLLLPHVLPLLTPSRHYFFFPQEDEGVLTFQSLLDFRLPVYIAKFAPKREKKPKGPKGTRGQHPGPGQSHGHSQGREGPAEEQSKPANGSVPPVEAPADRKDEAGPDDAAGAAEL